ncbi:DUF3952 domain-containing protein [Bacillus pseudomycoides]|uniref:DUF3952 domain-containing protein n=3 Tax=Bacillaceae TaxID=186817 RepID=UPI000381D1D9|nr:MULTISPECIES: DUF3952 domain-containing protein [Bacillus]MBJ8027239.1 DUF3952 domain-containing protein [Bacillus cereus group sp. N21]MCR8858519.1 DUF3952 domain-containing protein [Bacillus pseudomycoides]MDR4189450.1 DUF3952 domain-containing protein [Bacillus pseudomycoides]MED0857475.1 DUF3952 domain-containing protein [Bacillus pseudomycoides]MED1622011.1 DUF3952 domain-containing protein [Bacillus pseudomycoides]
MKSIKSSMKIMDKREYYMGDKMRKLMKLTIKMLTLILIFGGCSVGETKIEYERLVKALDEGDMKTVMSAGNEGYAHVEEQIIHSIIEEKEDGEYRRTRYQTTDGIYNTNDKSLYGTTTQEIADKTTNDKNKENNSYKSEEKYNTYIIYKNDQVQSLNPSLDVSSIKLVIDNLEGIGKLKTDKDTKGFDEPNSIGIGLTEVQFKDMINDKLKLQYDKFQDASIVIDFNSAKDRKEKTMRISEITISITYDKKNEEGKMLKHIQQIAVRFNGKEENTKNAKKEYLNYKKQYCDNK